VATRFASDLDFLKVFVEPTCGDRGIVDNRSDKLRMFPNQIGKFLSDFQNESAVWIELLLSEALLELLSVPSGCVSFGIIISNARWRQSRKQARRRKANET